VDEYPFKEIKGRPPTSKKLKVKEPSQSFQRS